MFALATEQRVFFFFIFLFCGGCWVACRDPPPSPFVLLLVLMSICLLTKKEKRKERTKLYLGSKLYTLYICLKYILKHNFDSSVFFLQKSSLIVSIFFFNFQIFNFLMLQT